MVLKILKKIMKLKKKQDKHVLLNMDMNILNKIPNLLKRFLTNHINQNFLPYHLLI